VSPVRAARLQGRDPADLEAGVAECPVCGNRSMRAGADRWECRTCGEGGDWRSLWSASRSIRPDLAALDLKERLATEARRKRPF